MTTNMTTLKRVMKTSRAMQAIITHLADKHGVNLTHLGAYLKLEMSGYLPLHIEVVEVNQVAIAHTFIDLTAGAHKVVLVCFTGYPEWVPIEITQSPVGICRRYVELSDDESAIVRINTRGQADLTSFTNLFARNIAAQGWLTAGTPVKVVR